MSLSRFICEDFAVRRSVQINIQIRAVEAVAAVGTGNFAVLFDHLVAAPVTNVHARLSRSILIPFDGF